MAKKNEQPDKHLHPIEYYNDDGTYNERIQTTFGEYLKTKKTVHVDHGKPLVEGSYDPLVINKGIVHRYEEPDLVVGILFDRPAPFDVVANGDENYNDLTDGAGIEDRPTISFDCVGRLAIRNFLGEQPKKVAKKFLDGSITIVAFNPDKTVALTASEKACRRRNKPISKQGYTVVDGRWHQAATVVLKCSDKYILVGQDEGTYFGVELPCPVESVDDAYRSLVPTSIAQRKDLSRQGEWFVVPVPDREVPEAADCLACFEELILPRETPESNTHRIKPDGFADDIHGLITKDGRILAKNFSLEHDEHSTVTKDSKEGWHTFVKNVAVRSVSVQGVD